MSEPVYFGRSGLFPVAFAIVVLSLGLSISPDARAEDVPDQFNAMIAGPLKKEFGRELEMEVFSDRKVTVVRAIGMKIKLKAEEIDRSWAEKVIRAMRAAGATEVEITADNATGPSEVRANNVKVGEVVLPSVQFVARPGEEGITVAYGIVNR